MLKKRENKFRLYSLKELSQHKRTIEDKFPFHHVVGFSLLWLFRAMGPNQVTPHRSLSNAGTKLLHKIRNYCRSHSRAPQDGEQANSPYMHGQVVPESVRRRAPQKEFKMAKSNVLPAVVPTGIPMAQW